MIAKIVITQKVTIMIQLRGNVLKGKLTLHLLNQE